MAQAELPREWMLFLKESQELAGISPFNLERTGTKRHVEAARIIANASNFVDPCLINGLLANRFEDWLRGGTEAALLGRVPDGPVVKDMLTEWKQDAESGIERMKGLSRRKRATFAWTMHDRLLCIHPFKQANGRTALLMLNHVRLLLGLPVHIVQYRHARRYFNRLEKYRTELFLPSLKKRMRAMKRQERSKSLA